MEDRRKKTPFWADARFWSIALTVFLQTVALTAWAASLSNRVEDHERRILVGETLDKESAHSTFDIVQRLVRVEEKQSATLDSLDRIEANISELQKQRR